MIVRNKIWFVALAVLFLQACGPKKGRRMSLYIGGKAPDFTLPDADGNLHTLSAYRGKRVALYFYPKDGTSGCANQACSLRNSFNDLAARNIVVLGISHDSVESHAKFKKRHALPFALLSDTDKSISTLYDACGLLGFAKRKTFLIDEKGVIVDILDSIDTYNHAQQIIESFDMLPK